MRFRLKKASDSNYSSTIEIASLEALELLQTQMIINDDAPQSPAWGWTGKLIVDFTKREIIYYDGWIE